MKYRGIYLDNDAVVTQKLDKFLKYEMTVAWPEAQPHLEIQILIAHKNARFLKLWCGSCTTNN
ncbi:lactosylceramide 4-alpha-galactosyltransferase-like protein [Leptotrombidium deliense]|uniref:Lactosylceramide 4-alpha-galactosyltransferase-like protein n=1 Tax=Leptotrombidium deliense TaxID=299467 RepID=A0A443RS62_9ACAR|nr:lactosylceramide 4-alpha-galactosyltransferase-like protein [Leptotrombidium deliense]